MITVEEKFVYTYTYTITCDGCGKVFTATRDEAADNEYGELDFPCPDGWAGDGNWMGEIRFGASKTLMDHDRCFCSSCQFACKVCTSLNGNEPVLHGGEPCNCRHGHYQTDDPCPYTHEDQITE